MALLTAWQKMVLERGVPYLVVNKSEMCSQFTFLASSYLFPFKLSHMIKTKTVIFIQVKGATDGTSP
jgi:hypothetical protein